MLYAKLKSKLSPLESTSPKQKAKTQKATRRRDRQTDYYSSSKSTPSRANYQAISRSRAELVCYRISRKHLWNLASSTARIHRGAAHHKIQTMNALRCLLLFFTASSALQFNNIPAPRTQVSGRRSWLGNVGTVVATGSLVAVTAPQPSLAESPPPIEVHEGFDMVRREMSEGGVAKLAKFVENEEWDEILKFTKLYDLSFRKVELYRVCEALTDKTAKAKAKELRSTLTYDLIAVNKASRPQFRNIAKPASEQAMATLIADLEAFLALEPPL